MATEEKKDEAKVAEGVELDVPSTHQRYLDNLLGKEAKDRPVPKFGGETHPPEKLRAATEEGYVGVDPIYQNHANDTEKPLAANAGPDKLAEDAYKATVEGKPKKPGDQLSKLYGEVSNTREDGDTVGGDPVKSTLTPPASDASAKK